MRSTTPFHDDYDEDDDREVWDDFDAESPEIRALMNEYGYELVREAMIVRAFDRPAMVAWMEAQRRSLELRAAPHGDHLQRY